MSCTDCGDEVTSSLATDRLGRKALSDRDWKLVGPKVFVSHGLSEEVPTSNLVFGAFYTPEPTHDDSVTVSVPDSAVERMEAALARIKGLASLEPNWDSYGAVPLQRGAVLHTIRLVAAILQNEGVPLPAIVPTSEGGLQLEWHRGRATLEMEVLPDRTVEVFFLMPSGRTWEGKLANNQWRLETFLTQLLSENPSSSSTDS
jgi:hypothetical protein